MEIMVDKPGYIEEEAKVVENVENLIIINVMDKELLFGQMAQETLLADLPVYSSRLKELDFELSYPDLAEALTHLIENG